MKRILYVNPIAKASGAEFSLLALMSHLDRARFEPILLCPTDGPLPQLCRARGIQTVFLPTIPLPGGRARDTYRTLLKNVRAIKAIIQELGIDLVHSNTPRAAYHGGLAARWAGIPHVTHVRDISFSPFASPLKARFIYAISARIVAVSHATKTALTRWAPYLASKIRVAYNGVGPATQFDPAQVRALRAELSATDQTILLATVGQLAPWKGQDVVLRALPSILARYPDTRLLVVGEALLGDQTFRARLVALADELRVSPQVSFTGFRRDIPLLLAAIDMLVHCPVEPDPLPRILLEASAQGTLIVASDIGGTGEVVLDGVTGRLVPPKQPARLAEAILSLLDDPARGALLRLAAGQRARQVFSIEQHVAAMEAIYDSLPGSQ